VTIEERAKKWAEETFQKDGCIPVTFAGYRKRLVDAYLAGSAQTQEERAEKWANSWVNDPANDCPGRSNRDDLIEAYLAGSARTQQDYSADMHERRAVAEGWPPYGWAT
jgi:hypothetical protein